MVSVWLFPAPTLAPSLVAVHPDITSANFALATHYLPHVLQRIFTGPSYLMIWAGLSVRSCQTTGHRCFDRDSEQRVGSVCAMRKPVCLGHPRFRTCFRFSGLFDTPLACRGKIPPLAVAVAAGAVVFACVHIGPFPFTSAFARCLAFAHAPTLFGGLTAQVGIRCRNSNPLDIRPTSVSALPHFGFDGWYSQP